LCDQFRICKREVPKLLSPRAFMLFMAITVGGVCMWAMHFVAMSGETYYAPNGDKIDIRYRIDYTIVSLIIPVILCYCGIYVCSKDRAFTEEKSDVLGEFVKNAEHMSIQELKAMKSANYVLAVALFRSLDRIILGGFMTAIGVCVMHFLGIFVCGIVLSSLTNDVHMHVYVNKYIYTYKYEYIGMHAIVADFEIEWNAGIIASSVVIALVSKRMCIKKIVYTYIYMYMYMYMNI
jgi:NO-binding membrane sensor protein with MHYT domain